MRVCGKGGTWIKNWLRKCGSKYRFFRRDFKAEYAMGKF
jgi:hypothetical protein